MDLSYSTEHQAYQAEVRQFLDQNWEKAKSRDKANGAAYIAEFRRKATERGYLNRWIPKKYGGSEQPADVMKAQIIRDEFTDRGAAMEVPGGGMMMLVPVLLECGTDWQKEYFIPKTMTGEYKWCQGYSEPGSGSDLASLKSKAELVGDEWVINGQKIWTTLAQQADFMFALLRTEPQAPKHAGLSYILFDFKQPGVTIRPIRQMTGAAEFCETFLDNVKTPKDWIVGKRGEGWQVSKVNLKHERNGVGAISRFLPTFERLVDLAQRTKIDGKPAIQHSAYRDRIGALKGFVHAQVAAAHYQLTLASRGESPGILGLTNKICMTNMTQEIANIASDILGDAGLRMPLAAIDRSKPVPTDRGGDEKWNNQVFGSLGISIAGGTSNIQRNIIAERGLGLPRDIAEN